MKRGTKLELDEALDTGATMCGGHTLREALDDLGVDTEQIVGAFAAHAEHHHSEDEDDDCGIDDIEVVYEHAARHYRVVWSGCRGTFRADPRAEARASAPPPSGPGGIE